MNPSTIALLMENNGEEFEKFNEVIVDLEQLLGVKQSYLKLLHKTWLKQNPDLIKVEPSHLGDWYVILAALEHLKNQGFRKPQVLLTRGRTTFDLNKIARTSEQALIDELPEQENM